MSWDINRVIIVGRLSNDVDLKYTPSGTAVAKFGIAVGGKPKSDGGDSVSFFNVVVWGKTAENCSSFLNKGKQVAIDGRIEQRSWTAQDGSRRSVVEIIADRVEFLGSAGKPANNEARFQAEGGPGSRQTGGSTTPGASAGSGVPGKQTYEDNFYDNTNFDPTPIDPNFQDEQNPEDPNF